MTTAFQNTVVTTAFANSQLFELKRINAKALFDTIVGFSGMLIQSNSDWPNRPNGAGPYSMRPAAAAAAADAAVAQD